MEGTNNTQQIETAIVNQSSKKIKKAKGYHNKKRFLLFDPSSESDIINLCDDTLTLLNLEDDNNRSRCTDDGNADRLDFDKDSSDEEDVDLPIDNVSLENDSKTVDDSPKVKLAGLFCGSCNVQFSDFTEHRFHYTLDWHRYNLKRKLHGQSYVSESKFSEMIDDLSSIDGSDNEEENVAIPSTGATPHVERLLEKLSTDDSTEDREPSPEKTRFSSAPKSPKIFLRNSKGQILTCYKKILLHEVGKQKEGTIVNPSATFLNFIKHPLRITIIMASGGHFAAAIFDGNSCTHHKTFHSYTVRAKQGGTQESHDAKSGTSNAKSAGASLRRYNQLSFTQHVQELLASWKSIPESNLVFYKAISANANILFAGKNPPLSRDSPNLRTIPFPTKRPTFNEVKRVHSLLTAVHVYDSMDSFLMAHSHYVKDENSKDQPASPSKQKSKKVIDRAKSRSPKRKDELCLGSDASEDYGPTEISELSVDFSDLKEFDDNLTSEDRKRRRHRKKKCKKIENVFKLEGILGDLYEALQLTNSESFHLLLDKARDVDEGLVLNQPVDLQSSTLLHVATKMNKAANIWALLEYGCDPAIKDKSKKFPYNYAESRECRDTFRKFMGQYPDKYDYKKAQVPHPLTDEMEKERAEKKKQLNKVKREKDKQKKILEKEKEKEVEEQTRFLNLSDREKRALAAEQRILAQYKKNSENTPVLVRCFECAGDITGKVPFEYNQNVFCTPKCLGAHRKKFPSSLSVV